MSLPREVLHVTCSPSAGKLVRESQGFKSHWWNVWWFKCSFKCFEKKIKSARKLFSKPNENHGIFLPILFCLPYLWRQRHSWNKKWVWGCCGNNKIKSWKGLTTKLRNRSKKLIRFKRCANNVDMFTYAKKTFLGWQKQSSCNSRSVRLWKDFSDVYGGKGRMEFFKPIKRYH